MKLSECVELYIEMKQRDGHPYTNSGARLRAFARRVGDIPIGAVSVHHVLAFIETPETSPITWQFKYGLLRNFFLYCKGRYPVATIPMPPRRPPPPPNPFVSRVYSREEIRSLIRATAEAQRDPECIIDAQAFRAFLLFLYATGARISEARRMLLRDVHLQKRTVTIRGSSFARVRTIPIGFDLYRILSHYLAFRSHQRCVTDRLFVDKLGRPFHWRTVQITFHRICRVAGLKSSTRPCRLCDLKNSFVVHRLGAWSKEGRELRSMVPALCAYMGHVGISSTDRYLRLTPERFGHQLDILSPRRGHRRWSEDAALMDFLACL